MNKVLLFLFPLCVLLSACNNDDDTVASRTIFTFKGLDVVGDQDWWVIIHDGESGDLIDSKQVFPNTTTTFESTRKLAGGKLTVTFFVGSNSPFGYNVASVYSGIDPGSTWAFGRPPGVTPAFYNTGGQRNVKIADVPSLFSVATSGQFGETTLANSVSYTGSSISLSAFVTSGTKDQMIVVDTGVGNPKYWTMPNTSVDMMMSYSNFQAFDKYVKFTFPKTDGINSYITAGYKYPQFYWEGYTLQNTQYGGLHPAERTELSIGFLNSIPNYYLYLQVAGWTFHSEGNPPSSIEFVSPDEYTATATSFDDLKITTSKDYVYSGADFGYSTSNSSLDIFFYSAKGTEKAFYPLTSEIESKYQVDKSSIHYLGTTFMVKGRSYAEMVSQTFAETIDANRTFQESSVYSW